MLSTDRDSKLHKHSPDGAKFSNLHRHSPNEFSVLFISPNGLLICLVYWSISLK